MNTYSFFRNNFLLDVDFPVEVFCEGVVVRAGVGFFGLHGLGAFLQGADGFPCLFKLTVGKSICVLGGGELVLEVLLVCYQFDVQFMGNVKIVLECGEPGAGFGDVWGYIRRVDKAGKQSMDLGDNGFLILGEGARGFQHVVDERQDYNSRSSFRVGNFQDGHDAGLHLVGYENAT